MLLLDSLLALQLNSFPKIDKQTFPDRTAIVLEQRRQAAQESIQTAKKVILVPQVNKVVPAPHNALDGVWARLRQCESGNNYANKSNPTYRGAYQFSYQTWRAVGGSGDPADAPPAEQDMRAQMLAQRANPYTQWPVCWPKSV